MNELASVTQGAVLRRPVDFSHGSLSRGEAGATRSRSDVGTAKECRT
jgi:hypothetical protein